MVDAVLNYLDKFGPELLVIQFGFLVILSTLFLWLWFSNRKKYHNLKHSIPANVVKNYLDSIIQNSTALKSSLFRGGGLETDSMPSVIPLNNLVGGEGIGISGAPSTALLEEVNQKKALISSLEAQLNSTLGAQKEFEAKLQSSEGNLSSAQKKVKELESLLAEVKQAGGGGSDSALKSELSMVTKERDEIRDRLKEFEIISDDLANLKRLQQENEQLKRSLAAQGGTLEVKKEEPQVDAKNIISQADVSDLLEDLGQSETSSDDNQALEDFLSSPDDLNIPTEEPLNEEEISEEVVAAPESSGQNTEENKDKPKSEKTPEDLLSEFEKMLG